MKSTLSLLLCFLFSVTGFCLDASKMNKVLGLELFGKDGWQENPRAIGNRLGIYLETTTVKGSPQYAGYPRRPLYCLGAGLTYLTIKCSGPDEISSVVLMLTNKGDSGGLYQGDFKRRFKNDARTVSRALEAAWGKTRKRQDVCTWTVGDAVVAFTNVKDEYLSVEISREGLPARKPDNKQRLKDRKDIKHADYTGNLERNNFGDCFIRNVPMINQGGKGYCGPATVERSLLYYGVTAYDMHELAEIFETKEGGGTMWSKMLSSSRKIFPKHGISVKQRHLKIRVVKDAIDKGNLIIWHFLLDENVDARIRDNSSMRSSYPPKQWREVLDKQKRFKKSSLTNHVGLIIGYNELTEEIAISDSWGDFGKIHWLPCADAEKIGGDNIIVLEP